MGFFNSNKSRAASIAVSRRGNMRSTTSQNRRMMRMSTNDHINGARSNSSGSLTESIYMTKQQSEAQSIGFTAYSLKYGDVFLIADTEYIIPQYKHDIDPDIHNLVRNDIFEGIKADKVMIVFSPKKKQYMIMAVNDDYSIAILFKSSNFHDLPINTENIDLDNLHPMIELKENANRLLVSVFFDSEVLDLTSNPLFIYRIIDIFRK